MILIYLITWLPQKKKEIMTKKKKKQMEIYLLSYIPSEISKVAF